jgi:predicted nucleic-acid-binding protein
MLDELEVGEGIILEAALEESCSVLEFNRAYRFSRDVIYDGLSAIVDRREIEVSQDARQALDFYGAHPKLDFMDCLLAVKAGMKRDNVLTFDKDLIKALS